MKIGLSFLLITLFGPPVFGEDLKVYAAAAFKSPLVAIATQYETATGHRVTLIFDTAGATEQKFRDDPEAALLITTMTLINDAEKLGRLKDGATYRLVIRSPGLPFRQKPRSRAFPLRRNSKLLCWPRSASLFPIPLAVQQWEFTS